LTGAAPARAIDAVVVAFNSDDTLDECLRRLRQADDVASIWLVDNGSDDRSIAIAQAQAQEDSRLQLLRLSGNPGFAAACNAGAARCRSPWLAFVNPDCLLDTDSLLRLRDVAATDSRVGLLGADLVDVHGRRDPAARRLDPEPWRLLKGLGDPRSLALVPDDGQALQPVEAVSGALMLMPAAVFHALNGFDTGYRLHAEDLDLCRRVREAGHVVAVANAVRVVHLRGTSSRRRPIWVEWQKHRSLLRYWRRFTPKDASRAWKVLLPLAVWARFLLTAPLAWWRARR